MFELLAAARFAHFAAICALFGLAAFPFYAGPPGAALPAFPRALRWAAVLALLTAWIELLAMSANMGGALTAAFDPQILSAVTGDTQVGRVWMARIVLAIVLLAVRVRPKPGRDPLLLGLSGLLLASVALTGHSGLPGGVPGLLHTGADAVHLIAAGWWIGGLLGLVLAARKLGPRTAEVLERFSGIGYGAVAAIVLTGVFKSALLLNSVGQSVSSAYGWVLLAKVGAVGAMGAIAFANKLWITPRLKRADNDALWAGRLQRQVTVEFALGIVVLALVGALGAMQPPISS